MLLYVVYVEYIEYLKQYILPHFERYVTRKLQIVSSLSNKLPEEKTVLDKKTC